MTTILSPPFLLLTTQCPLSCTNRSMNSASRLQNGPTDKDLLSLSVVTGRNIKFPMSSRSVSRRPRWFYRATLRPACRPQYVYRTGSKSVTGVGAGECPSQRLPISLTLDACCKQRRAILTRSHRRHVGIYRKLPTQCDTSRTGSLIGQRGGPG